jgi:hypothetical protein
MNRPPRAIIEWIPTELGGRKKLPPGEPPLWTVLRFCSEPWPAPEAWSAGVRKIQILDSPYKWLVEIIYRVPEAPHHMLQPDVEFELYEGKKLVARGKIIGAPD